VGTAILIAAILTFLGLLSLNSGGAAREGSYRRGPGWYLDVRTPRDVLMKGRMGLPGPARVPRWSILLSCVAGGAFLAAAVVAWFVADSVVQAVIVGVLGLALLGLAWDGVRRNRRVSDDEEPSN
jgi:hypothetical protein